jgi:NAD(P)-dependent dehydrogenase (short-subunit alcohol dehydrogenase family)
MTITNTTRKTPRVLITGAGTGIGRATAERFLKEGWSIVAVGRRTEPLEALHSAYPGRVLAHACDLTKAADVERLSERLKHDCPEGLSALINNAGAYERVSFLQTDDAHWERMFEANLFAPVRLTRALLPLLEKTAGAVINVSSTLGLRPVVATSAYAAAKAALVNWTQSLALEMAGQKVRVNCVCPGIVDTPIHPFHTQGPEAKLKTLDSLAPLQPLGRIGRPEEVAHAIWSLSAPGSEWMTGSILTVDGGIALV